MKPTQSPAPQSASTPTPWIVANGTRIYRDYTTHFAHLVASTNCGTDYTPKAVQTANAALIVQAVNERAAIANAAK